MHRYFNSFIIIKASAFTVECNCTFINRKGTASTLKLNSFNAWSIENHWASLSRSCGAGGSVPARQLISLGWNSASGSAAQGQHVLVDLHRCLQEVDFSSSLLLHSPFFFKTTAGNTVLKHAHSYIWNCVVCVHNVLVYPTCIAFLHNVSVHTLASLHFILVFCSSSRWCFHLFYTDISDRKGKKKCILKRYVWSWKYFLLFGSPSLTHFFPSQCVTLA